MKREPQRPAFLSRLDISLKRLGLDHVDILHHHGVWKREAVLYEPILKAMEKAKKDGKIRFAGISTHRNEPETIQAAMDSKFYDVVATAYNFRQKHQEEMKQAIAKAAEAGLGIIGMKAMGGSPRSNYGRDRQPEDAQVALKWVFQNPNIHMVIAGFTAFDELEMDLKIMENMAMTKKEKSPLGSGDFHGQSLLPGVWKVPGLLPSKPPHSRSHAGLHVCLWLPKSGGRPGSRIVSPPARPGVRRLRVLPREVHQRFSGFFPDSGCGSNPRSSSRVLSSDAPKKNPLSKGVFLWWMDSGE